MPEPIIVATVQHRETDRKGRRLGHVGFLQRRTPKKMGKFGGDRYASWACRTVDGIVTGTPERFETYANEDEARAHAEYAAGKMTPSLVDMVRKGGKLP